MKIEIINTTTNYSIDDIFTDFRKFVLNTKEPKSKSELYANTINLKLPMKIYCTLKCYCSNIGYNEVDKIRDFLSSHSICRKFDLYVDEENESYSIVKIKSVEERLVARYGLYQPCVENYFEMKAKGKDSWIECLKESLTKKPIMNYHIYSDIRNILSNNK